MERWGGKMLTKDECLEALEKIKNDEYFITEDDEGDLIHIVNLYKNELKTLRCLIEEHFDNPPLKPEELRENMWVWDNKSKTYHFVRGIHKTLDKILFIRASRSSSKIDPYYVDVEENRFYRKQVEE